MKNSFSTKSTLNHSGKSYEYFSLPELAKALGRDLTKMPYSHRVLLENLLRHEDGEVVRRSDIEAFLNYNLKTDPTDEIQFTPARVLLQDFTGVPVVVDLAAMREAIAARGGNPQKINPLQPVDLVIDHSVQVDVYGTAGAYQQNAKLEFERNRERYEFLKWGQKAFRNFSVVPPATGICHQVNLEYLSHVAMSRQDHGTQSLFPDTLVGTDSHTTMINGLGVVGWGVGGIEAEAAMLGHPISMLIPQVIGVKLLNALPQAATATDLVLTVTQMLRKYGVVGKFVEFFGPGLANLSIADRATIGNMAPEYGATIGIFPVDTKTIAYLRETGRDERAARAEMYFKAQGLWHDSATPEATYTDVLTLDLASVEPCLAGPARPHDRTPLAHVRPSFRTFVAGRFKEELAEKQERASEWINEGGHGNGAKDLGPLGASVEVKDPSGQTYQLTHGSIVIAAITSCTNTSNPHLMLGAALLARNAVKKGLNMPPWVKTSFAPGSKAVTEYVSAAGLTSSLDALGFQLVGYGCTTCIGNSGPMPAHIQQAIDQGKLATAAVLSGNRNFEARIHSSVLANYLASPLLVVAYALAGNINVNLASDPIGKDGQGYPVYLNDIWPDQAELDALVRTHVNAKRFSTAYGDVFAGDELWRATKIPEQDTYAWDDASTYIRKPPFLDKRLQEENAVSEIRGARILAIFGDFITTDHISPAGSFSAKTPAGMYLTDKGVSPSDFNSYGSRRGNHEVMMRGTFANVRIKNQMVAREGGYTVLHPEAKETTIYEASMEYEKRKTPLVVFGGKLYGSGSSRDWAAKGPRLLGVRVVIAESFERIHRSNLVGMGILPLELPLGMTVSGLKLKGDEEIQVEGLGSMKPKSEINVMLRRGQEARELTCRLRIDTSNELKYFRAGGILPFVLNQVAGKNK
ncbi:MAG: aconitate hydratase AcnA [Deltaproteobacteria bacterium]|nr:aconitate hydratase AcnA [Deltaproteobacteria bacterium]